MIENVKGVRLETERLVLREHVFDDWIAMEEYTPKEHFWRYLRAGRLGPGSAKDYVERLLPEADQTPRVEYKLAVVEKAGGGVAGSFRLGEVNHNDHNAMIGYALDPEHWGKGYATEAVGALIAFGFAELGLHRIHAACDVANHASYRVMEKLGLSREGLLRENKLQDDVWRNTYVYAILASD